MNIEEKIKSLGFALSVPAQPLGSYLPARRSGNLLFISGQLPKSGDNLIKGKLGADLSIEEGKKAAEIAFINVLSIVKQEIGSLEKVDFIVRLSGYINSAPGFDRQPDVMNGASDLAVTIFGDNGKHSRIALGAGELPLNAACEIDAIFQIKD